MAYSSDAALLSNQQSISLEVPKTDDPQFVNIMSLYLKRMADSLNTKEGALYLLDELATFQQYYTSGNPLVTRNVYRTTVNFGALPNTTTKSVAHGISFNTAFSTTRIYASATDPVGLVYLPIPYSSATLANNIELYVDSTNVNIITAADYSAYTICSVVIEYVKN